MIRYANTRERCRIAFHTQGQGPALVMLFPYHVNHLGLNWRVPLHRGIIEFLARYFTVVNLDFRGAGLSERGVPGLSLELFAQDIEAVLAALQVERVALCAMGAASLVACQFAAGRPNRVSGVVFVLGGESEANRRVLNLRRLSPSVEANVRGGLLAGLDDPANASALASVARQALDPNSLQQWEAILGASDLLALSARVAAPALCIDAADDDLIPRGAADALAESLVHGTAMIVPGRSGMDVWRDRAAVRALAVFVAKGFEVELGDLRATKGHKRARDANYPAGLSPREVEVLRLLAVGRTNRQIAERLFISLNTVSHHLRNIFAKTGAANRTEAASFGHRHGLTG